MHLTSEQPVAAWAIARDIPAKSSPLQQMSVTIEEVNEAQQWWAVLNQVNDKIVLGGMALNVPVPGQLWAYVTRGLSSKDAAKVADKAPRTVKDLVDALEWHLSLKLGDILVTLVIQCHMQGSSLGECISLEIMSVDDTDKPIIWENVDLFVEKLCAAIEAKMRLSMEANLISLFFCVSDIAGEIGLTPDECLTRTYEKIRDRQGAIGVNGK